MTISMYQASVPAFVHTLTQLSAILDKAEAYAAAKKILASALARPDAAAVLADVAACRLDPHAAADLLLERIS